MQTKLGQIACTVCVVLFAAAAPAQGARVWYVDTNAEAGGDGSSGAPFTTIAGGLAAAQAGDTVEVRRGNYDEAPVVPAEVTLASEDGATLTTLAPSDPAAAAVVTLADGSILRGFTLIATERTGVAIAAGAAIVTNCVVVDGATGAEAAPGAGLALLNNTFFNNTVAARAAGGVLGPVRNNVFSEGDVAVDVSEGMVAQNGFNALNNIATPYLGAPPATSDFPSAPLFVFPDGRNFHLQAISQLRNAGDPASDYTDLDGSRNDVGADGGPFGVIDRIAPQPRITTTPSPATGAAPFSVQLLGIESSDEWGIAQWEWDFDAADGVNDTDLIGFQVIAFYDLPGRYLATMRAIDNSGLAAEARAAITVGNPPGASVTATPAVGAAPLGVQFAAAATGTGPFTYAWDFDGDALADSSDENPQFVFTLPGLYRVQLIVTDAAGVPAQYETYVSVAEFAPPAAAIAPFTPAAGGSFQVELSGADFFSLAASLAPAARAHPFSFSGAPMSGDAVALAPEGDLFALFEIAPQDLRLSLPGTVFAVVPGDLTAEDVRVWYYDAASQAWFQDGITRVRAQSSGFASLVSFDTGRLGIFAITGPQGSLPPAEGENEVDTPIDRLQEILIWLRALLAIFGGPCFIATAAYDSPFDHELGVLRDFRDDTLLASRIGAAVVDVYYAVSPPIAAELAQRPWLRSVVRAGIGGGLWCMQSPGLGILLGLGVVWRLRRTWRRRAA